MDPQTPPRPLPYLWADFMRGSVRCMFPVISLVVLAGLLLSGQGRDVLRALVSSATQRSGVDTTIAGLAFLLVASATLSVSVWYSSRWLLTAQMPALPLPPAGFWQTWLPRALGLTAPLLVAVALLGLNRGALPLEGDERDAAFRWALAFIGAGALLLVFYIVRGRLIDRMGAGDPDSSARRASGRDSQPAQLPMSEPTPPITQQVMVWSIALSMAVAALFLLFPITLPRVVGPAAVAALALASINLFGSFVLTYAPLRHALPPLWIWVILIAGLLFGSFNDNHVVQPARVQSAPAEAAPEVLKTMAARMPRDGVPIFVASEGGGIRAAYWTAAVLDALDALDPTLKQRYVVLSGVSGGSLGVASWLATHRADYCGPGPAPPAGVVGLRSETAPALPATRALSADFVSPAVAGMFYGDLMQRFLPVRIGVLDRSRAIEGAWQRGFAHLPGQPFDNTLEALYAGCPALPQLIFNATRVETGERVALTRLPTDRSLFVNTFDAMQHGSGAPRQTLAGLVHHSARFPLVSPAGTVPIEGAAGDVPPSFRLVDGGYFDNSGVQSALDLMQALPGLPGFRPMRPLLLVIRNGHEPLDQQAAHAAGSLGLFPESGSVGLALANVRGSHAVTVRGTAKRLLGDNLIDLDVPAEFAEAPLGWALSGAARRKLDGGALALAKQQAPLIAQRIAAAAAVVAASGGTR